MRPPVERIREAILDPDQFIRDAAVAYFAESFAADDSILPLVRQAVERYGRAEAFLDYSFLDNLSLTETTLVWLLRELQDIDEPTARIDKSFRRGALAALAQANVELLGSREHEFWSNGWIDEDTLETIQERIDLAQWDPDHLWRALEELDAESDGPAIDDEFGHGCRLVEALARHPENVLPRLPSLLASVRPEGDQWLDVFAVRLAGELEWEAAVPVVLTLIHEDADDWMGEVCERALIRIGSDLVVEQLAEMYSHAEWFPCVFAAIVLRHIHSDLSVRASLRLFASEEDEEMKRLLLQVSVSNFASEAIEPARQFVLDHGPGDELRHIRDQLVVTGHLLGQPFPEFDEWLAAARVDSEKSRQYMDENPEFFESDDNELVDDDDSMDDDDWSAEDDFDDENGDELDDDGDFDPLADEAPDAGDELGHPVRRAGPRVGRNDPCPCGSGRKYKKCCYRPAASVGDDESESAALTHPAAKYPIGTVALYGPDDKTTTKIAAGVINYDGAEPIIERWVGTKIKDNPKVQRQLQEFFQRHRVKSVIASDGNLGCPHEEGSDFPHGEDCPFCPFWAGKQGSNRRD